MKGRWFMRLFYRRIFVTLLILLQLATLVYLVISRSAASLVINIVLNTISLLVAIHVMNKNDKGEFKLVWVFLILLIPIFGGLLYLLFNVQASTRGFRKRLAAIESGTKAQYYLNHESKTSVEINRHEIESEISEYSTLATYLDKFAGFPVSRHTVTKYLSPGEKFFPVFIDALRKAEKYIFLEYFIVHGGVMWDEILDILKIKAASGVEVRLIYDDIGCFFTLPDDYTRTLENYGIKSVVFNKYIPIISAKQNNRDHRKIAAIDGKIAFTGGINLADEYINAKEKYGYWKDSAIMLEGGAAWSMTVMFLQMWALSTGKSDNYVEYYPWRETDCPIVGDGYVQPYSDSPSDNENVGENVYMNLIYGAKKYLYICTPYLIIDNGMLSALCLSAKSGVDVRIITPAHADKWFVHLTTQSYYPALMKAGVKIYEYSDGFIHSKEFVCDDITATVGTINLDFRSLFMHFECGVWLYKNNSVKEVLDDMLDTINRSKLLCPADIKKNAFIRFLQSLIRLFAPLM